MTPLQTSLPKPPDHSKSIGLGSEALGMGWDGTGRQAEKATLDQTRRDPRAGGGRDAFSGFRRLYRGGRNGATAAGWLRKVWV